MTREEHVGRYFRFFDGPGIVETELKNPALCKEDFAGWEL